MESRPKTTGASAGSSAQNHSLVTLLAVPLPYGTVTQLQGRRVPERRPLAVEGNVEDAW